MLQGAVGPPPGNGELASAVPIRLGGLSLTSSEQDVLAFFARHGVAERITSAVDGPKKAITLLRSSGQWGPTGQQAVVLMRSRADADVAQEVLHGKLLGNRWIEVRPHDAEDGLVPGTGGPDAGGCGPDADASSAGAGAGAAVGAASQAAAPGAGEGAAAAEHPAKQCHLHKRPHPNCQRCQRFRLQQRPCEPKAPVPPPHEPPQPPAAAAGGEDVCNLTHRLRCQISASPFYKRLLHRSTNKAGNLEAIVEWICEYVDHVEPHSLGSSTEPSSMFCCVFRLLQLQAPEQVRRLLDSKESPYVRAAGFLAMRFSSRAHNMWEVFQLYLFDQQEIKLHSSKSATASTTIGTWLKQFLLNEDKYFTTILPRLPLSLKHEIGARLLQITELALGFDYHRNVDQMSLFSKPGTRVEILGAEAWEEAKVVALNVSSEHCCRCVVSLGGGRTLEVSLGFVRLPPKSAGSPPSCAKRARRSRSRSASSSADAEPEHRRAVGAEEDPGSPNPLTPRAIRQRYMRLEREKACVPAGGRVYHKPYNHRIQLMGHEPGYRTCKLQDYHEDFQRGDARGPQGAPDKGQEQQEEPQDAPRLSAKRRRELAEVYHKYGSSADHKKAPTSRRGMEVEAPDTFRLG